ncbi:hypothetical protein [Xanthomonas sp. CFBP 8445]|uniref:hypothetical protein n=1 Tax=Xanthomonas sp. CFBP 8445 TaxID=2971236 RepID=UPI0021DFF233|nr:hypothetical protein [Xanthomonas sp. CFBP 8445]UYC13684.1 hypothetical protein NUG21_08165 [Xanthomonas sp. CFBP 8445]
MINVNALTLRRSQFWRGFALRQADTRAPEWRTAADFVYGDALGRRPDVTDRPVWRRRHEPGIRA